MKNYNTTNMRHHLETKPEVEFAALLTKEKELDKDEIISGSVGSSNQPTIIETLLNSQPFSFDHPIAKVYGMSEST